MRSHAELAAELVAIGVATLHEANGRKGLASEIHLLVGDSFAGPAVTVALPAGDNLGIHLALETAIAGTVVCVSSSGVGRYGVYGELLHEAARARDIAGLMIDDGIRDTGELRPPPSVACRGVTALGTVKRRVRQPVGADIAIDGVLIRTGDWIICDPDGGLVLPQGRLQAVLEHARQRRRREEGLRGQLRSGSPSRELLDLPAVARASIS
jgi:4-hydroxy-4-methyl-2-oxoglutarate aldolase